MRGTIARSLLLIAVVISLFVMLRSAVDICNDGVKKEKALYEQHIGEQITIDENTFTIVDFDSFQETFTLSNGTTISKSFVIKEDPWEK